MKLYNAKRFLIITVILFIFMSGCSTNKYQKNYDLGIKYLEEGDYENAIISLNAAIEIEPKEEAYLALADAYTKQEDYENAIASLNKSYQIAQNSDNLFELARIYGIKGDYAKVVDIFEQIYEEYGAIVDFKKRPHYCPYENIPEVRQQYIEKACTAFINDDVDTLYEMAKEMANGNITYFDVYTIWNDYKIQFSVSEGVHYGTAISSSFINITIIPENGTGYDGSVDYEYDYLESDALTGEDEESYAIERTTCNCVNYLRNGECLHTYRSKNLDYHFDSVFQFEFDSVFQFEIIEKGNVVNNLRDGLFTGTKDLHWFSDYYNNEESETYTRTYNKGVLIDYTGEEEPPSVDFKGVTAFDGEPYFIYDDTINDLKNIYYYLYW